MCELFSSLPTLYCGYEFIISKGEDNNIFSFGSNNNGKCGQDLNHKTIIPKQINNLNNIQFISCGSTFTLCCDYDGKVYSFGDNYRGQLGLNKSYTELRYSHIPQQINLPQIQLISCGFYFSICLSINGELWSFGQNTTGELGIGNTNNSIKPLKIKNLSNIDYIICGGHFTFCKTVSNDYYSWGKNNYGQLAQGHTNNLQKPHICDNIPDDILSIRGGTSHTLFLTIKGIVYSCGYNKDGQIGHNNNEYLSIPKEILSLPIIKKISCGYNHSLLIDITNNLWVFGNNYFGQLGLNHHNNVFIPVKNEIVTNIIDLSFRSNSTYIKTLDNNIYVMGDNIYSKFILKERKTSKKITEILKDKGYMWITHIQNTRVKSARK